MAPPRLTVVPSLQDLPAPATTPEQLDSIKAQLDLVLLSLEAIANLGSEAMLQAAEDLNLSEIISDRLRSGDCANPIPCVKVAVDARSSTLRKPEP